MVYIHWRLFSRTNGAFSLWGSGVTAILQNIDIWVIFSPPVTFFKSDQSIFCRQVLLLDYLGDQHILRFPIFALFLLYLNIFLSVWYPNISNRDMQKYRQQAHWKIYYLDVMCVWYLWHSFRICTLDGDRCPSHHQQNVNLVTTAHC